MPTREATSYDATALEVLQKHYASLKDKPSYDAFIRSGHALLQRIGADPFHVRMALTRGHSMMEFGSRAAYRHKEDAHGIGVGLLVMEADLPLVPQELRQDVDHFKPSGETAYVKFTVPTWADIPPELLAMNEKAMRWEYERIKDTKLVEIRRGSSTDNEALRHAVVNGITVPELPETTQPDRTGTERMTMTIPLNRIFYGPPGTGKTFHTVGAAVAVCDPAFYAEHEGDHTKLRERFNALLIRDWDSAEGRIGFCTFHQSYSYEDFVEGIKPVMDDGEGALKYSIREGILKLMARRASGKSDAGTAKAKESFSFTPEQFDRAEFYKLSLGAVYNKEDEDIYHSCIRNNVIALGYLGQYDLTNKAEKEINELPLQSDQSSSSASQANYFRHYLKKGDYVVVTRGNLRVRAIGKVTGDYRYAPELGIPYPHIRSVEWLLKDQDIPWEEIYSKTFVQRPIYKLIKEEIKREFFVKGAPTTPLAQEAKSFVLIIDEINRGNVAGIFGELITLIEENKRKGRPEALEVTLPYSQEPFSIPDNLYIIGTMNTADRSVEALDAALRRRFSFTAMMPEPGLLQPLQGSVIDLAAMLERINARLVHLLDEDHQIGHSHFWDLHKEADPLPALRQVFRDKVIPQLEEYFHRDRAKLQLVLGDRFVSGTDPADDLFLGDANAMAPDPRTIYTITPMDTWDEAAFCSLYEKV